ncbi:MAG: N-terminal phage integrase SAM-like domain-containing protein [Lactobacillus iners]|nr:N-terminal phage integrase SAM-like domain-containing protein [Lactobacillus iners]
MYKIWFEGHKNVVKESSASLEPGLYKNHIEPYFGNQFINKIVVADLQKWADKTAIENDKKTKKQLEFFS